ncbi:M20/M25/M40 family metallo-hydrolase [Comamonas resistens]|uniref:M20/M25/M40 family metallo-hydrolase n=1 Tax=Comamonas resistens TaxID=3046670 RepID=A0ABY8SS91_9BURK|nr:M20/M25/M40 family metallo-hydrolase [Comamonas resistens]MDL5037195.1 M20/M25/M40 family metallo-hydrolase [Comamonas resistens]WHS65610.1 M20/M25/M40 family metallo-hydrolase [Comamonas resistens]
MPWHSSASTIFRATPLALALAFGAAHAAPQSELLELAKKEQQPYLDTLRDLVHIESGSKDVAGVKKIAEYIAAKLKSQGAKVEFINPTDIYRLDDTPEQVGPMVHAEFKGKGTSRIMLIAHMDTVYLPGMIKDQPFRVDGDKAYGLGIADDKQGVALILHIAPLLKKLGIEDYGTLTVLINGDEEISSPGARSTITRLGAEQDAVFSFEGGGTDGSLRLATSGIGAAYLKVQGKASHAGAKPEDGVNALYELSHQLLQMKDLSKPEDGLKLNWTVSKAGTNRNVVPAEATAQADARALRVADFTALEKAMQDKIGSKLLPASKVELKFEVRRPPLEANDTARKLAAHAKGIYDQELKLPMKVMSKATGGGTDAAFAALKAKGGVIEGFGLSGYGAHSNDAEYVQINTIAPRLYLAARMIQDLSRGQIK